LTTLFSDLCHVDNLYGIWIPDPTSRYPVSRDIYARDSCAPAVQ